MSIIIFLSVAKYIKPRVNSLYLVVNSYNLNRLDKVFVGANFNMNCF
jgi:hypothetical protein